MRILKDLCHLKTRKDAIDCKQYRKATIEVMEAEV